MKDIENTQKGFDYRVHVKDPKTGKLVKYQPYQMKIENGMTKIERPIGSGQWFYPNGEPIKKETKVEIKAELKSEPKKEKAHESQTDSTS